MLQGSRCCSGGAEEDPWAAYVGYDPDEDDYDVRTAPLLPAEPGPDPLLLKQIASLEIRIQAGGESIVLSHYACVLEAMKNDLCVSTRLGRKRKVSDFSDDDASATTECLSDSDWSEGRMRESSSDSEMSDANDEHAQPCGKKSCHGSDAEKVALVKSDRHLESLFRGIHDEGI
eukprot:TRINITY_DN4354_c0_g1_i2.p1 TRINITY_DN4354_c0_g1~~TRINITY_DN4354_c0_g1_i2.p1  ORF type:complete len:174 (-),score=35.44 TRINITY_DN4354_c0_g1_i2:317-838(-)